ncbi:acyl-ACP--UDP-N-acetylglucosamine O-acyltransferase [Hymenobacter sp. ASUV-10]|uniref:Acyl-ACP--UDP-N-acetylglucosamine O-acyltransferase n=1 Tax=Hymenobacter aranciens TaxID=3063996 RepID=A0ABT9B6N4_9BACT|nr:acyl-ACP--UDP-N-acetylglucosamine O-acyltransferase [Hymenobacter sp. ASUV-10]MDO7873858.1 acyl-ACP--UDP-N-acetylglucosamine O-acyltransferase [Hymenobacter sp. ASUV-10]
MISPLAYIHPDARLAPGVSVDPFTTIAADVEIGEGTWIGPNVTIMDGARIGAHCQIFPGAVVAGIPQDLKFAGEKTTAHVGDHTVLREYVTVNRGTVDRGETRVGAHCLLQAYVHVAHDCLIGDNCVISGATQIAGHVTIGDWGIIGGGTLVQQFVSIGAHAFVGGGSLVRKDVPPYVKAAREPLTYAGINSVGLRRRGFGDEQVYAIQNLYRLLYLAGLNTQEALARIEEEVPVSAERDFATDFIRAANRGIIKGPSKRKRDDEEGE